MPSTAYYRCAELRRIEADARSLPLMQRAGTAAADLAQRLATTPESPVLILAGPGNNGGDAFVAATVLRARGYAAHVVFAGDAQTCLPTRPTRTAPSSPPAARRSRRFPKPASYRAGR